MNEDTATIEWQATGPGANISPPLPFQCRLRGVTNYQECTLMREFSFHYVYSECSCYASLHYTDRLKSSLLNWVEQWRIHY